MCATVDHYKLTVDELIEFYKVNSVHFYSEEQDVVYVGNGYVGLHSAVGGKKRLRLPCASTVSLVYGTQFNNQTTDCIEFELEENATALFLIS